MMGNNINVRKVISQVNILDIKCRIISVECLELVKSEIEEFAQKETLNRFQRWIIRQGYILDTERFEFDAKSIFVAAFPLKLYRINLHYAGKAVYELRALEPFGLDKKIHKIWKQNGYILEHCYWLPQKRLAVCSGLAEYGRNNLVYADEYGSICMLYCCLSDMPWDGAHTWRSMKNMEECNGCMLCTEKCPTVAIKKE